MQQYKRIKTNLHRLSWEDLRSMDKSKELSYEPQIHCGTFQTEQSYFNIYLLQLHMFIQNDGERTE